MTIGATVLASADLSSISRNSRGCTSDWVSSCCMIWAAASTAPDSPVTTRLLLRVSTSTLTWCAWALRLFSTSRQLGGQRGLKPNNARLVFGPFAAFGIDLAQDLSTRAISLSEPLTMIRLFLVRAEERRARPPGPAGL